MKIAIIANIGATTSASPGIYSLPGLVIIELIIYKASLILFALKNIQEKHIRVNVTNTFIIPNL